MSSTLHAPAAETSNDDQVATSVSTTDDEKSPLASYQQRIGDVITELVEIARKKNLAFCELLKRLARISSIT